MGDRVEEKIDTLFELVKHTNHETQERFKVTDNKIDNLANAVGQGFKEVNNRFDRVEARLTVVEQKIDLLRADVQELRYDYKKMLTRIEKLELQTFGSVQE